MEQKVYRCLYRLHNGLVKTAAPIHLLLRGECGRGNDQQVVIAIGVLVTPGARTKQHNTGTWQASLYRLPDCMIYFFRFSSDKKYKIQRKKERSSMLETEQIFHCYR